MLQALQNKKILSKMSSGKMNLSWNPVLKKLKSKKLFHLESPNKKL